jgi:hypothetical protein
VDELKVLRGFVEHEAIIFPRLLHLAPAISKVIVDVFVGVDVVIIIAIDTIIIIIIIITISFQV